MRSIWRFLSTPRGLFRRSAASREERRLLSDLRVARSRERVLAAARASGERVEDQLTEVRARVADIAARLPRGHTAAFCAFAGICVLSAAFLRAMCGGLRAEVLEMWGTLDNPYLLDLRYCTSRLAKAGFFLTSSVWAGLGLLIVPVAVWFVQRRLERRHARALAAAAAWLVLATVIVFSFAVFSMLFLPLFLPVQ